MALKYLHSDLVKILKYINIEVPERYSLFNEMEDLMTLIDIL